MIEKEAVAPEERRQVAAVIYNRLHARMPLGIDATIRYGLDIPPTKSILRVAARERQPVQHAQAARACRRRRSRTPASRRSRRRRTRRSVDYLYFVRKPDKVHHFFTASETEFLRVRRCAARLRLRMIGGAHAARRAARRPGRALALAADAERRVRGARARLGVRRARRRAGAARGRGARARGARLRRRERDDPAQDAPSRALCDEADGDVGQHARLPRRARARVQHRRATIARRDRRRARLP